MTGRGLQGYLTGLFHKLRIIAVPWSTGSPRPSNPVPGYPWLASHPLIALGHLRRGIEGHANVSLISNFSGH
jgi:hypothetical protein